MDFLYNCSVSDTAGVKMNVSSTIDEAGTQVVSIELVSVDGETSVKFETNKNGAKNIADMIKQIANSGSCTDARYGVNISTSQSCSCQ